MSAHDFDFFHGNWRVHNRRLRARLAGCTDWDEFDATMEVRPILGGGGNVDRYVIPSQHFEGMTLRLFDPATQLWSIHWADNRRFRLDPPLTGRFENDLGTFYGDDTHDGIAIRVRFYWRVLDAATAQWEQSFSADGGATWETNWIMTFTRE